MKVVYCRVNTECCVVTSISTAANFLLDSTINKPFW